MQKSHFNELNLKIQGKQRDIANLLVRVNRFKNKIQLFKLMSSKERFEEIKDFEKISLFQIKIHNCRKLQKPIWRLEKNCFYLTPCNFY